ncbi:helix-turn-helix domain-containing protein [Candidatus Woesearchaeota archaeon]|nr:helix-turn-helix domain-containing protein [Candidatus Woesearchaeota archaeon]
MKRSLMDDVSVLLLRHGYTVKTLTGSSFDMVARKDARVLLVKVLEDANSISDEYAASMKSLSSCIGASPVIVAEKAGHALEEGVVYLRSGVYTCNHSTFGSCLENQFPIVISTKAGFTASVIGEKLRKQREERGYSLGIIARKVGVSKRMIAKYESNKADISLRGAIALNRLFGDGIFNKVDVFAVANETASSRPSLIARKYDELGFRAADTKKAPFDVVAKLEKELILTDVKGRSFRKPNQHLESMQQLLDADALVIFDKEMESSYQRRGRKKLPALQKRDFMKIESAGELIKFLKEFE